MHSELTVDFLDKALLYLKSQSAFSSSKATVDEFTKYENKLLVRAMYKLEKDGYAYTQATKYETQNASGGQSVTFYISFDGLLALEEKSFFTFKNRPYKNKQITIRINNAKKIAMTILNILNSIAILYLMWRAIPSSETNTDRTQAKTEQISKKADSVSVPQKSTRFANTPFDSLKKK